MTKARKSHVAELAEKLNRRAAAKPIDFNRLFERVAQFDHASSLFAGTFAPAGIPQSSDREQVRNAFAAEFKKQNHDALAQMAAELLEGAMLWRSMFKKYADSERQRRRIEHEELFTQVRAWQSEVSGSLSDGSMRAYLNVQAKLARDPKQAAKAEAFKLWQARRAGKHPTLRTNEQFATECQSRWPVLTSAKNILGWCTQWNKDAKRKSQSAS